jgi:hypothetical protein
MRRFLLTFLSTIFFVHSVLACSCTLAEPATRDVILGAADVVFVGRPVSVTCNVADGEVIGFRYEFVVERAWTADVPRRVIVDTPLSSCGFMFEPHQSYLISATRSKELTTTLCSYSGKVGESVEPYLRVLGKPRTRYLWSWLARTHFQGIVPECLHQSPGRQQSFLVVARPDRPSRADRKRSIE